jgi:hypothetical protein
MISSLIAEHRGCPATTTDIPARRLRNRIERAAVQTAEEVWLACSIGSRRADRSQEEKLGPADRQGFLVASAHSPMLLTD